MKADSPIFFPALASLCIALLSCSDKEAKMGKGFRLSDGDVEAGKVAFSELKCTNCHTVEGASLPVVAMSPGVEFPLGGEVRKVKRYGELVTAIIQPQHVVSPKYRNSLEKGLRKGAVSPMPEFNETMTVRQLTDIVSFLHAHYSEKSPEYEPYPYYMP